ncbi:MAG TPA: PLxRFG domain-containing protein, partial [Candidatus Binatia bacterium]|nr:PLxRFG domain-containing protein [Candidatus Binatia bacterium]
MKPALRAVETKPPRRKFRLEDSEIAPSTYIKRYYVDNDGPGITIPDKLKEEFGGWNRWVKPKGVPIEDIAEEMVSAGILRVEEGESAFSALMRYRATAPANRKSAGIGAPISAGMDDVLWRADNSTDRGELIKMATSPEGFVGKRKADQKLLVDAAVKRLSRLPGTEVTEVRTELGAPPKPPTIEEGSAGYGKSRAPVEVDPHPGDPIIGERFKQSGLDITYASDDELAALTYDKSLHPTIQAEAARREAMRSGRNPTLDYIFEQTGDPGRMSAARPSNPDPIDDLAKAQRDGTLAKILGNERGAVWFGQNPRTNSIKQDRDGFFDRMGAVSRSFREVELKDAASRFWNRITSGQEMAKQHPEFKGIYQPFHAYPRKAVNALTEDIDPLFFDDRGVSYFNLYKANEAKGRAVDAAMIQSRLNRQGQPRMSDQMLRARGLDDDQIRAYNSVLDYGERILQRQRDFYVERKLEALVEREVARQTASGQAPLPMDIDQLIRPQIKARLEAEANEALRGLDHWVPFYRSGEKTVWVFDQAGNTKDFGMAQNVRERVDLAKRYREKYPASQGYIVQEGLLEEFAKSKAFDEIDLGSLEVLARFARLDPTIVEDFIGGIRPQLMKRSRALERQLHAKATPGFKEDLREGLISAGDAAHHYIERQKAKDLATKALGQIDPRQKPELFKFSQRYIDENLMPGNRNISKVMNATYTYYMAGSVKQYPLQFSQLATVVYPRLTAFVNDLDAMRYVGQGTKVAFGDFRKQSPEMLDALRQLFRRGVFQPRAEMFSPEPLEKLPFREAQIEQGMAQIKQQARPIETRYYERFRDASMLFVTDADLRSRVAAATAFYKVGREKLGMTVDAAIDFAEAEANHTSYLYGRADSPQLFGRVGPLQILNVFRSWNANYASFLRGNFLEARRGAMERIGEEVYLAKGRLGRTAELAKEKEWQVIARSVGVMFGLGGVLYNMPTAFRNVISSAWGVDPETEMRRFMAGKFGVTGRAAEGILRGAPAAMGVDLSRSLSFGDMFPGDALSDVLGAPFSMMERTLTGAGQLLQAAVQRPFGPDIPDALELLSPAFLRNTIRGTGTIVEGGRTKRGGMLAGGDLGVGAGLMQGLGFTPTAVTEAKALQRASQVETQYHRTQQSRVLEDLARGIIAQNQPAIDRVTRAIEVNNQKAIKESRPDLLITIDNNALRQRIAEMMTPQAALRRVPKVMRQR